MRPTNCRADRAGNVTSATATVYKTDTFGNLAAMRDAYKINAWYVVPAVFVRLDFIYAAQCVIAARGK